jgi:putative restriction endonuclease
VGLEAAHVRWHSQDGPDVVANGLALCALHHALFDLGVLGLTAERRIRVSGLYVARSDAGLAVDQLAGQTLIAPRPGQPAVELGHISWHGPAGTACASCSAWTACNGAPSPQVTAYRPRGTACRRIGA